MEKFQKTRFCDNCGKFLSISDKRIRQENSEFGGKKNGTSESEIDLRVKKLLAFGQSIDSGDLVPVLVREAADLIKTDPFAFILAAVLDRGTKTEIIWTIPYYIKKQIGSLVPGFFAYASLDELGQVIQKLPVKPRYVNDAPKTMKELSQIIMKEFDGEAKKLWENKRSSTVKATLERIYGVGPGIASMIVLLLEEWFKVQFDDLDHRNMDVKSDVHVIRVFYRLGLTSKPDSNAALSAARRLNPSYPGALDAPTWTIGRKWCTAFNPNCNMCPLADYCPKNIQ
jgi:endonuclease III